MSRHYQRLFEPAVFENGLPNPRHLSNEEYLALARAAALRGARRNGVRRAGSQVDFPAGGFAPTRIEVSASGEARVRVGRAAGARADPGASASATAEIAPDLNVAFGMPTHGSGGGYDGPLAYRMGKPMRPDVAAAFDRMAAAARREAGLYLSVSSAAFAPTPSRRSCGTRTRTRSGSHRRAPACTATPPSSTSARRPPTAGSPPTPAASASSSALRLGALAFRLRGQPARPRASGPVRPRLWEPPGGDHGRVHHRCRPSCRPVSTTRSRARRCAGTCR